MNIFTQNQLSGRAVVVAVGLLVLQIPVSHQLFFGYLAESAWHYHLVITFLAIALLLAYKYGFRGGIISSVLSTIIVLGVELTNAGLTPGGLDVPMTITVVIATLATGISASVAVGLLAHILQAQRKWLEALFASASDGFVVVSGTHEVLAMNPAAQQLCGWTPEGLNASGGCAALFGCERGRAGCSGHNASCPVVLSGNSMTSVESEIHHRDASTVPVALSASPIELPFVLRPPARSMAVVLTLREIATARRLQAELDGLAKVCTDIASLENINEIFRNVTERAAAILGADLAVIGRATGDGYLTLSHVAGPGAEHLTGLSISGGAGVLGRAFRLGAPVVVRQPNDAPESMETDPIVAAAAISSQIAVPFGAPEQQGGVLGVGWLHSRVLLPNQVTIVRQLAHLAGVALENSLLLGQIQRRRQEAEALYRLGLEISSLSDFDRKLELVLDQTRALVDADVTALWVINEGENAGTWKVVTGQDPEVARIWLPRSGQGLVAESAQAGRVLVVEQVTTPPGLRSESVDSGAADPFRSAVALPLRVRGKSIGALFAGYVTAPRVNEDSVLLLSGLSNQLSVALENARLYGRVQELAVIEERHRLSREIHDGLAQLLSVLNLRAESLKKGLGRLEQAGWGDQTSGRARVAELAHELEEFQVILDDAYGEVRHSIWNLRGPKSSDHNLADLFRAFIDQFRRYSGISVHLEDHCPDTLRLPMSTELQVIRVVQEALNNVRKHSGVKSAILSVKPIEGTLVVQVLDEGRGFPVSLLGDPERWGLGLLSMRERATAIGATLAIDSVPDHGTTVTLSLAIHDPL